MQVGPSSSSVPSSQPVELFLPQTSLSGLQSTIGSQELNNQAPAPGTTIFVVQGGVGVVANPGQQPPEQLFQTTVGGNVAPQGQANLFVFGIQNGKMILGFSTVFSSVATVPVLDATIMLFTCCVIIVIITIFCAFQTLPSC